MKYMDTTIHNLIYNLFACDVGYMNSWFRLEKLRKSQGNFPRNTGKEGNLSVRKRANHDMERVLNYEV